MGRGWLGLVIVGTATLLLVGVLAPTAVARLAPPQHGVFAMYGPTNVTCGAFTASKSTRREVYEWWALGFISGADMVIADRSGKRLPGTDADAAKAWIAKYCAENPLDEFVMAPIKLVEELTRRGR